MLFRSPLTDTIFDDPEQVEKAKALNRCVTVEVIDHGEGYLFVKKDQETPGLQAAESCRYAVMLYISKEAIDMKEYELPENTRFFERDGLFFYHTVPSDDLVVTMAMMNNLKKKFNGIYPFKFR